MAFKSHSISATAKITNFLIILFIEATDAWQIRYPQKHRNINFHSLSRVRSAVLELLLGVGLG